MWLSYSMEKKESNNVDVEKRDKKKTEYKEHNFWCYIDTYNYIK